MEQLKKLLEHPIMVIVLLAGIGLSDIVNLKLQSDPNARPDPFTGTEGKALEARIIELEKWRNDHADTAAEWYEKAGRWDAQIESLMKHHERHHSGE